MDEPALDDEGRRYLRDVQDHAMRVEEQAHAFRALLQNILSVNLTLETKALSEASHAQNEQVKRISAWAAILFAPTLVGTTYGMNFEHMPELEVDPRLPLRARADAARLSRSLHRLQAPALDLTPRNDGRAEVTHLPPDMDADVPIWLCRGAGAADACSRGGCGRAGAAAPRSRGLGPVLHAAGLRARGASARDRSGSAGLGAKRATVAAAGGVGGAADVLAGLLHRRGQDAVAIVANSFGCQVALMLAQRRPELVGRLALVGPTVDPRYRSWTVHAFRLALDSLREPPALWRILFADYARMGFRRLAATAQAALEDRPEDIVASIRRPVLVVRGERDAICTLEWAAECASRAQRGSFAPVAKAAHAAHFSHPLVVARLVESFLTEGPDRLGKLDG